MCIRDSSYTINAADLLQGYTDVDGDTLSITGLSASVGTLANNNDGTWTLTTPQDFNGKVDLSYSVSDGNGASTAGAQSFSLTPVNDAPVVSGAVNLGEMLEDGTFLITSENLLATATDVDGDKLIITSLNTSSGKAEELLGEIQFSEGYYYNGGNNNGDAPVNRLSVQIGTKRFVVDGIRANKGSTLYAIEDTYISDLTRELSELINKEGTYKARINTHKDGSLIIYGEPLSGGIKAEFDWKSSINAYIYPGIEIEEAAQEGKNWIFTPEKDYSGKVDFDFEISDHHPRAQCPGLVPLKPLQARQIQQPLRTNPLLAATVRELLHQLQPQHPLRCR